MTWVVYSVFVIWLALSIANQIPFARKRLTSTLNSFGLLPAFSLFAPEPVDVDYHLVWRDLTSEGTYGDWQELIFAPSTPGRALWNPGGRDLSALIQVVSDLSILASAFAPSCRSGHRLTLVSRPYLFLLNAVVAQTAGPGAVARQFMVVETSGFGATRRVALGISSEIHALDG
jgi:hypothetical protein